MFNDQDYCIGDAHIRLTKRALATKSYSMKGRLIKSKSGWGMLTVPNALVRGAFDALHEIGAELPLDDEGSLRGHISVFGPDEMDKLKVDELGHQFGYSLGALRECEPESDSRCWIIEVASPELTALRKSYGLSPFYKHPLHITIAVRKKGVLYENELKKLSSKIDPLYEYTRDLDEEYSLDLSSYG